MTRSESVVNGFAATLRRLPWLEAADEEVVEAFAAQMSPRPFLKREVLFQEGEPCAAFHILQAGQVRLFKTGTGGREQTIRVMRPGDYFCLAPLMDGGTYPVTAEGVREGVLLMLDRSAFLELFAGNGGALGMRIAMALCQRVRMLSGLVEDLSFRIIRDRLGKILLDAASGKGTADRHGYVQVDLGLTHLQLAAMTGTVREVISRTLGEFQQEGMLKIEGRRSYRVHLKRLREKITKKVGRTRAKAYCKKIV